MNLKFPIWLQASENQELGNGGGKAVSEQSDMLGQRFKVIRS